MALPDAVRQAEKEADEAAAAYDQAINEDTDQASALDSIGIDAPEGAEPPAETVDDTRKDKPEEVPEPEVGGKEAASDGKDAAYWEQKYRTLYGKYNAEVPRLTEDVGYLKGVVTELKAQRQPPDETLSPDSAAPKAPGYRKYLKDSELGEYEEPVLDLQARLARGVSEEIALRMVAPLMARIEVVEGSVTRERGQSFWERVEAKYPGANETNDNDPEWIEFLESTDELTGRTYQEIGEEAVAAGDVHRVVRLLNLYAPLEADNSPHAAKAAGEVVDKAPVSGPPVKPSKSRGGTVQTKQEVKPVFRESEVARFYTDVAQGKYAGNQKLREVREAAIEEAAAEGRIVSG